MELEEIKNKVNKISRENSIDVQAAWDILFFDEFLERLSKSNYKNRFVKIVPKTGTITKLK